MQRKGLRATPCDDDGRGEIAQFVFRRNTVGESGGLVDSVQVEWMWIDGKFLQKERTKNSHLKFHGIALYGLVR